MKCGSCALRDPQSGICPIFRQPIDSDRDSCPKYTSVVYTCDLCGTPISECIIDISSPNQNILCPNCSFLHNTCDTCIEITKGCPFTDDQSCPYPPFINKTVQQGPMVMTTQVRNPDRERITCEAKCNCWNPKEHICSREDKWCPSYKYILGDNNND